MVLSYLNTFDHPDEHGMEGYQDSVAAKLYNAYVHLKQQQYSLLEDDLAMCQDARMARTQRMRVFYLLGEGALKQQRYQDALDHITHALADAAHISDPGSTAVLAKLAAMATHELQHFAQSHTFYLQAASALSATPGLLNSHAQYEVAEHLAIETYLLARYDDAVRYLQQARRIAHEQGWLHLLSRVNWVSALIFRWHQHVSLAYQAISNAASHYERSSNRLEVGRFRIVYADIVLDCSEQLPAIGDQWMYLQEAEHPIAQALADLTAQQDEAGVAMALLAHARYLRLTHQNADERVFITQAANIAERLQDKPLLAQAYTALGEAFRQRHEAESARTCYRLALDKISGSDALAYHLPPWRALRQQEELTDDEPT